MAKTIFKRTGNRGGLTVPVSLRREMGLQPGDPVEITLKDDNKIEVSQYAPRCMLCGTNEQVQTIDGKGICQTCAGKAGALTWQ